MKPLRVNLGQSFFEGTLVGSLKGNPKEQPPTILGLPPSKKPHPPKQFGAEDSALISIGRRRRRRLRRAAQHLQERGVLGFPARVRFSTR